MTIKHVSIRVSGRVQGVFFRAATKEKADELQIKGKVWNNDDGSVSIEAEGEEQNLERFLAWCRQGPPSARVDRCEIKETTPQHFGRFFIQR